MNPQSQQSQIYFNDGTNLHLQVYPTDPRIYPMPMNPSPVYFDENMVYRQPYQNPDNVIIVNTENRVALESSPDKGNLNDTFVKEGQIPQTNPTQQYGQNLSWSDKLKAKKNIVIGVTVGVVILIIVAIVLGVLLSKKDTPPPIINTFSCDQSPIECQGVPQAVNSYIFQNYNDPDQVRSLLQASRSFSLITSNTTSNATRQNLTDAFRNISRSVQCLSLNLPEDYPQAFQKLTELQFSTQQSIQNYLSMTESFSGQPLKLVSASNLAQTCKFNLSESRRRLLQQMPIVYQNTTNTTTCSSNATSVLIYFSGIGYSPSATIQNVFKMQQILSINSSTNFDAGIIALGAWRTDLRLGYFSSLVTSYESYLRSNGYTVPSRYYLYSTLRMILNLCRNNYCRPPQISSDLFLDFWRYYVRRSIYSFTYEDSYYEYARHRDFVIQQVQQGKKVVLLAHAQGSVYANKVYNLLNSTQKQSVKLVYVAPTVDNMADGTTNYITNPSDTIISNIRTNAQTNTSITVPLAANMPAVTFDSEVDFGSNHQLPGYAKAYKQKLTQLIVTAKISAVQPVRSMGNGPITITLSWDIQPDIDLHIIEPDGTHVYYSNKRGNSGYLDVDDTSSYGPEHYYTNCNPKTGNYTVYIYFYSGYSTSSTITTVSAGTQYFMKSVSINPYKNASICTIGVEYDNITSSYQFTIYPAE